MENLDLALIVLLTGLVVVFAALIVLTYVIKGYGALITSITAVGKKKKAEAQAAKKAAQEAVKPAVPAVKAAPAAPAAPAVPAVQEGIPGEVIAAIAAAVDYTYGAGTHTIRAVRRVPQNRSAWGSAALAESTRPF